MNSSRVFETLGVAPTEDYKALRKAYINRLKRLNKKLAKVRGTEDQEKVSEALLELNEAFNTIEDNKDDLTLLVMKAKNIETDLGGWDAESLRKFGIELVDDDLPVEEPQVNVNIENLKKSLRVDWEPRTVDLLEEVITLKDFLNGTVIMTDDNVSFEVPPLFLGIISRLVGDDNPKLQFVRIKGKDAVVISYTPRGDYQLKTLPENATFDKGILRFSYAGTDFEVNIDEMVAVNGTTWVGVEQGLLTYGSTKKGDVYINKKELKGTKNPKVYKKVMKYLFGED